jgi:hypothetical protein
MGWAILALALTVTLAPHPMPRQRRVISRQLVVKR